MKYLEDAIEIALKRSPLREMYRDSQHGLTIDLSGPEGNAFAVLGVAKNLAKQLDKDWEKINAEMTSGDYDNLIDVFDREFGSVVSLLNRPGEENEEVDEPCDEPDAEDEDDTRRMRLTNWRDRNRSTFDPDR